MDARIGFAPAAIGESTVKDLGIKTARAGQGDIGARCGPLVAAKQNHPGVLLKSHPSREHW